MANQLEKGRKTMKKESLSRRFFIALGLAPSKRDLELRKLVNSSYKSLRVVGRGTIKIDAKEVRQSKEWRQAQEQVSRLFKQNKP